VTRNGYLEQSYGQTYPTRSPGTLTVGPGQHVTDLVFKLVPMGVMTGHVHDEDGEPVRNVSVQALRRSYSNGRWQLSSAASASTNDLGEYRLIGLSPSKYYLCSVYNGYVPATGKDSYVPLCYPGSTGVGAATPVDVSPGQEIPRLDFELRPIRTSVVRGLVTASVTGDPVVGANVVLMRRETPWPGSQMRSSTASGGHFELHAVPPGSYVLMATWFDKTKLSSGRKVIEVGDKVGGGESVQDVTLGLVPGSDVKGQVRVEGNAQLNLGTLRVSVLPQEPIAPTSPGARVDSAGAFVLKDVPEGTYSVSVCCPGNDFYLKAASMGSKDVLDEGFTVSSAGTAGTNDALDLLLTPAGGHIEGTVLRDKKPFAGALVALVPEPDRRSLRRYFNAATDEAGAFLMRGVPPGEYTLFAWERIDDGAYHDADTLQRYEGLGKAVRVDEGNKVTIDVQLIPAASK